MNRPVRLAAGLAGLLVLSGCTDGKLPAFLQTALDKLPLRIESPDQLESALVSRPPPPQRGPAPIELPRAKPAITEKRSLPEVAPSALVGLPVKRIAYWMGPPAAVWQENGHAMWRYVNERCVVLVFIDTGETVRHVRIAPRGRDSVESCARAISDHIGTVDIPIG